MANTTFPQPRCIVHRMECTSVPRIQPQAISPTGHLAPPSVTLVPHAAPAAGTRRSRTSGELKSPAAWTRTTASPPFLACTLSSCPARENWTPNRTSNSPSSGGKSPRSPNQRDVDQDTYPRNGARSTRRAADAGILYCRSSRAGISVSEDQLTAWVMLLPSNNAPGKTRNAAVQQKAGYRCGITLLLLLQLAHFALGKCPNWCSQHGICTGPGEDAFCICEMGYQGDDCGTSEFRDVWGEPKILGGQILGLGKNLKIR